MKIPTFYIDGADYTFPCSIERTATIKSSDNSGYLMNQHYFNDAQATYLTYKVTIAVPLGQEITYANLYEVLTTPAEEHTFTFPYNQTEITFTGRIETVTDTLFRQYSEDDNTITIWRNTSFECVGNEPIKEAN